MSERTIEFLAEVDNHSNIQGLDGDGFERNRIADTIATKVVVDTECGTVVVRMYIDGQRYAEGDYYTDDKADALATAKSIRDKASVRRHRGDHRLAECQPCADVVEAMRWWLDDCTLPDGYEASSMDADEIVSFVRNGYDGGIDQFLRDGDVN